MTKIINGYHLITKLFHWISAFFVFALFASGFWMVDLSYYSEWYQIAPHWHKSFGLCFLLLTVARLLWKLMSNSPPIEGKAWQKKTAISVHHLLYLLLFVLFLSGYLIPTAYGRGIAVFNWFELPSLGEFIEDQEDLAGLVHQYVGYALMALIGLHTFAALKHHFIDKDNTLKKML